MYCSACTYTLVKYGLYINNYFAYIYLSWYLNHLSNQIRITIIKCGLKFDYIPKS